MPKPENIVPHKFKPGQSGNPNGRPKGSLSLTTIIRQKLEEGDRAARLAERLVKIAESGEDRHALTAIEQILDRLEGKPIAKVEQTNITGPDLSDMSIDELRSLKHGPVETTEPDEQA